MAPERRWSIVKNMVIECFMFRVKEICLSVKILWILAYVRLLHILHIRFLSVERIGYFSSCPHEHSVNMVRLNEKTTKKPLGYVASFVIKQLRILRLSGNLVIISGRE